MTEACRVDGVAIVTGGGGGLGRSVVPDLLDAGAKVVVPWVAERERDALEEMLGDRTGDGLTLVEADLLAGGADAVAAAAAELGEVRSLVNLVGGFAAGGRLHEEPPEVLEKQIDLNLRTAVNACRAVLPRMLEAGGGSIVCVGTRTAIEPFSGGAAYAISKSAVLALVKTLHVEYREDGIRANAVLPSVIDTPANRKSMPDADFSAWVQPAEIARVIRFLCSEDSTPVSGTEVPVYGRS